MWATEEVLSLFDYIQATRRTDRPLLLAGFDTRISSSRGVGDPPAFLRRVVAAIDSDYADEVASFDTTFVTGHEAIPRSGTTPKRSTIRLDRFFGEHHDELYTREWGTAPLMLVPREQYDGVLLIDRVTAPNYLRF